MSIGLHMRLVGLTTSTPLHRISNPNPEPVANLLKTDLTVGQPKYAVGVAKLLDYIQSFGDDIWVTNRSEAYLHAPLAFLHFADPLDYCYSTPFSVQHLTSISNWRLQSTGGRPTQAA